MSSNNNGTNGTRDTSTAGERRPPRRPQTFQLMAVDMLGCPVGLMADLMGNQEDDVANGDEASAVEQGTPSSEAPAESSERPEQVGATAQNGSATEDGGDQVSVDDSKPEDDSEHESNAQVGSGSGNSFLFSSTLGPLPVSCMGIPLPMPTSGRVVGVYYAHENRGD